MVKPTLKAYDNSENKPERSFTSYLNPYNWGVEDYSDVGSFKQAYSKATPGQEFMYGDKRVVKETPEQRYAKVAGKSPEFWSYVSNVLEDKYMKMYGGDRQRALDRSKEILYNMADYHHKSGNPDINVLEKDSRAWYNPLSNTLNIKPSVSDYSAELMHSRQNKEGGLYLDFIKDWATTPEAWPIVGDNQKIYEKEGTFEHAHRKRDVPIALYGRQLNSNRKKWVLDTKNLSENDEFQVMGELNKLASMLRRNPNLHPDEFTHMVPDVQVALHKLGYDMKGSIKADGKVDGAWGEGTKKALNRYIKKIESERRTKSFPDTQVPYLPDYTADTLFPNGDSEIKETKKKKEEKKKKTTPTYLKPRSYTDQTLFTDYGG
jgi:hypothetical protein